MRKLLYISSLLLVFLTGNLYAQQSRQAAKKLKSIRTLAEKEFRAARYETSIGLYNNYLSKINFTDTTAIFHVAEAYRLTKQYDSALKVFNQLSSLDTKYLTNIAELYATKGDYNNAVETYKLIQSIFAGQLKKIESRVDGFKGREDFQLDSLDWKVVNSQLNTSGNESNPIRYKDGILYTYKPKEKSSRETDIVLPQLVFVPDSLAFKQKAMAAADSSKRKKAEKSTRRIPVDLTARNSVDNNTLRRVVRAKKPPAEGTVSVVDGFLQGLIEIGPISLSSTGDTVYYSRVVKIVGKEKKLGVFYAVKNENQWKEVQEVSRDFMYSAFHPTATNDGKKIYFVADTKDGFGGPDIYVTERIGDTSWTVPKNAGNNINTLGNELYPSILGDSLYFSSNGHGGLGGQDIFAVKLGSNDKPMNIGYPINSTYDDFGIVFNAEGSKGYVTSNRGGSSDIYAFNYKKVFYRIGGNLNYEADNTVASRKQVYLVDSKTELAVDSTTTDELGNYFFDLRPNRLYRVEQRERGIALSSYAVNTKEPVSVDSNLIAKRKDFDPTTIAMQKQMEDAYAIMELDRSVDSIMPAIAQLKKDSIQLVQSVKSTDPTNDEMTFARKMLIQSQLRQLQSDLNRLEYKKMELSYGLQPLKNVVVVNSTKPVEKIKVDIKLPGVSPKQRADSLSFARQQSLLRVPNMEKSVDSILQAIAQLKKDSIQLMQSVKSANPANDQMTYSRKMLIQSQLLQLQSDLNRLEYKKLESNYKLQPPKNVVVVVNSTKPVEKIKVDIKLPGLQPKQKVNALALVRQQLPIRASNWEQHLLTSEEIPRFDVYYDYNKSSLNVLEKKILDSTIRALKFDPTLYAQMGSFTDCFGSFEYNLQLSAKRSASVVKYFTENGIEKNRIRESYYGKSFLILDCIEKKYNAMNQTLNRRTEIYLSKDSSLNWKDIAADTLKKFTVYSAYGKKLSDFVQLKDVVVKAARKPLAVDSSQLTVKTKPSTVNRQQKTVDSSQLTVKRQPATVNRQLQPARMDSFIVVKLESKVILQPSTVTRQLPPARMDSFVVVKLEPKVLPVLSTVNRQLTPARMDSFVVVKLDPKVLPVPSTVTRQLQPARMDSFVVVKLDPKILPVPSTVTRQLTPARMDSFEVVKLEPKVVLTPSTVKGQLPMLQLDTFDVVRVVAKEDDRQTTKIETKPTTVNSQPSTVSLVIKLKADTISIARLEPKKEIFKMPVRNLSMINVKQDTFAVVKLMPEGQGTRDKGQVAMIDLVAKSVAKTPNPKLQTQKAQTKATFTVKIDSFVVVKPSVNFDVKDELIAQLPQLITLKEDTVVIVKALLKKNVEQPLTVESKPITVHPQPTTVNPIQSMPSSADSLATVNSMASIDEKEEQFSRDELLSALDSLAKLRREQERIVEYLTLRITKKPIKIFTYADSVTVEIFDSGTHDKDSVSVIFNKSLVVDKHELKVDKPIKFKVRLEKDSRNNQLVVVAENLGTYPPNTAVMIITDNFGKREEVMLSTDLTTNEVITFIKIDKPSEKPANEKPNP